MLPVLRHKQVLRAVRFPIYCLTSEDIYYEDGLSLLNSKVLDDKNQPGDSLGKRRLQTEHRLAPLGKICSSFIELIDYKHSMFIDTNGKPFRYEKEKYVSVKSVKINKKISRDTYSVLYLKGINSLYYTPRYPHSEEWAQIIYYDNLPWKLYSLTEEAIPTFRRKI